MPSEPAWPAAYERLAQRVRSALSRRVLALEHVGSTAVAGLTAKRIIDIDLTVADPADEDAWLPDREHGRDYNLRKQAVIREIYDRAFRAAGLL